MKPDLFVLLQGLFGRSHFSLSNIHPEIQPWNKQAVYFSSVEEPPAQCIMRLNVREDGTTQQKSTAAVGIWSRDVSPNPQTMNVSAGVKSKASVDSRNKTPSYEMMTGGIMGSNTSSFVLLSGFHKNLFVRA